MKMLGFALLLGIAGYYWAALYTFVIGLAGAPGSMLYYLLSKRLSNGASYICGLLLTVAGQSYVSLAFVAFVVRFIGACLSEATGFGKWVIWIVAFFVAVLPATLALREATHERRWHIQYEAIVSTSLISTIGFFTFVFFPQIINTGWGWIPQF